MNESIGIRLEDLISPILPINLSEAETDTYPYATYAQTPVFVYDKDGNALRIRSEVAVHIYDRSFGTAEEKCGLVTAAIAGAMHDGTFGATLRTVNKDCTEGVWDFELNYTIIQFKDYVPAEIESTPIE